MAPHPGVEDGLDLLVLLPEVLWIVAVLLEHGTVLEQIVVLLLQLLLRRTRLETTFFLVSLHQVHHSFPCYLVVE